VVAILVASAVTWVAVIAVVGVLFFAVFIPAVMFGGRSQIPSDFPVYPGATLSSAFASRAGGCMSVDATWSTGDTASRVTSYYQEQLSTGDWTLTDTRPSGSATVFYFKRSAGEDPQGYLSVESTPYSSTTQITLTMEKSTSPNTACHPLVGVAG
jgi:hypothetical protein